MRARLFAICALWFLATACSGTSSSISVTSPTAAKCEVAVENAARDAAPADGIASSLSISTNRDCTWTASTTAAWLAITSATTGQGSDTLSYRVSANAEPVQRRGVLEVNNTQVTVLQDAAPCRYTVTPANTAVSANGGELRVAIETLTGCAWTITSAVSWIAPPASANGDRSATVTLTVARNTSPVERTGTVTVGPQAITIQQAAAPADGGTTPTPSPTPSPSPGPAPDPAPAPPPTPPPAPGPCVYNISPTSNSVGSDGTTGTIQVTTTSGCTWRATESANWLTITSGSSGSGNGSVGYRVAANTGGARNATITAAGKTFTISQAAAPPPACSFSISPTSQNFAEAGGPGTIAINASANSCSWTATTTAPWISLSGPNSGNGDGNVGFNVAANTTTTARSATIAAAGKTFTVTQAAATPPPAPCTFSISPTTQDVGDVGGSGTATVTASAGTCAWTATSNAPWLTLTSGATGAGNGTVGFTIAQNLAAARSGTITIAGQTLTVSQAGAPAPPPCTFALTPTGQNVADTATSGMFNVGASTSTCTWTAVSNAGWLIVTGGASGVGNGIVSFNVDANLGAARTGTIAIGGQAFTVAQAAPPPPPCTFSISPGSETVAATGATGMVMVNASAPACTWTATSNAADWLTVTSGSPGTGSARVTYTAAPNPLTTDRTGTITVAGQTFTVVQPHP